MTVCRVIEDDAGVELRVTGDWIAPWEVRHASDEPRGIAQREADNE